MLFKFINKNMAPLEQTIPIDNDSYAYWPLLHMPDGDEGKPPAEKMGAVVSLKEYLGKKKGEEMIREDKDLLNIDNFKRLMDSGSFFTKGELEEFGLGGGQIEELVGHQKLLFETTYSDESKLLSKMKPSRLHEMEMDSIISPEIAQEIILDRLIAGSFISEPLLISCIGYGYVGPGELDKIIQKKEKVNLRVLKKILKKKFPEEVAGSLEWKSYLEGED